MPVLNSDKDGRVFTKQNVLVISITRETNASTALALRQYQDKLRAHKDHVVKQGEAIEVTIRQEDGEDTQEADKEAKVTKRQENKNKRDIRSLSRLEYLGEPAGDLTEPRIVKGKTVADPGDAVFAVADTQGVSYKYIHMALPAR